jgi:2-hydroxychromene-2-carboxylate isomerase
MSDRPAVDWYYDFLSPFAYLQSLQLPALAERASIRPVPILFAAVLAHCGQKGPAEIAGKREFTYRFVLWQAERAGVPLRFPPSHPFNPLPALRLAVALGNTPAAVAAIFALIWRDGIAADTPEALAPVARQFGVADVAAAIAAPAVKDELRRNTEAAIARGLFGVPTLAIGDEMFWGNDATAMFVEHLADPQRFRRGDYARIATLPVTASRS